MAADSKHLLVVDDVAKNIQFLGAILRDEGYVVSVALNGEEALQRARSIQPDLILMDVMMPVMDGLESCRRLKQDPSTANIPVIFLSAKGSPEDIVEGLAAGGVDYIKKPFQAVEVLQRITTHLELARLQHELSLRVKEAEEAHKKSVRTARVYASFTRHELSNALGPVLGYSDMLLRRDELPDETRRKWTDQIRRSAIVMKHLLAAIKELQQIEDGVSELELKPADVVAIVRAEMAGMELSFGSRAHFVPQIPDTAVMVKADATLLAGVFRNLIKNAIEHVIDLPAEQHSLFLSIVSTEEDVVVTITNGGDVIPEEFLTRFFDKFNSTKRERGGTGLGTAYARIVVEAHHGEIEVSSDPENGTQVRVTLPRDQELRTEDRITVARRSPSQEQPTGEAHE